LQQQQQQQQMLHFNFHFFYSSKKRAPSIVMESEAGDYLFFIFCLLPFQIPTLFLFWLFLTRLSFGVKKQSAGAIHRKTKQHVMSAAQ
jgi:hypothetical protein